MKKILLIIISMLFTHSCDPSTCYEYIIENKTDKNIKLIGFYSDSIRLTSFITYVFANDNYTEINSCYHGKGDGGGIHVYNEDSIQVKVDERLVKTYYPNDKGKSIFKTTCKRAEDMDSWKLVNIRDNHEKYVFTITEDDLK